MRFNLARRRMTRAAAGLAGVMLASACSVGTAPDGAPGSVAGDVPAGPPPSAAAPLETTLPGEAAVVVRRQPPVERPADAGGTATSSDPIEDGAVFLTEEELREARLKSFREFNSFDDPGLASIGLVRRRGWTALKF